MLTTSKINKAEMEKLWAGKIINSLKKNSFKGTDIYSMKTTVYVKTKVAELTAQGCYKSELTARYALEAELRNKIYELDVYKEVDAERGTGARSISWTMHGVREGVPA